MFVWTFHGVAQAIVLAVVVLIFGALFVLVQWENFKSRRASRKKNKEAGFTSHNCRKPK